MKNRSSYAVLTRFGIIAAILATLVLIAPAATAQSECELDGSTVKCTYVENGEDPVASFSATDDDGDVTTWALKEADDHEEFAISASGVLTFVSPPDYDSPGDVGGDNVYNITVLAEGGDRVGGDRAVEVTVTDLNEPGTVSFKGNQQPQVGASMGAELADEDGQTVRLSWQWSKSMDMDAADEDWENVSSTTASYTPKEADIDSYLRATVSYTDVEYDEADEVSGVTTYAVRGRPAANAAPKFEAQSIEVFENTDGGIGTATASDDDVLLYRLWETGDPPVDSDADGDNTDDDADNDNARFKISDTGDLSLKDELDFEQQDTDTDSDGPDTDTDSTTDIDGNNDIDGDDTVDDTENIVEYTVVVTAIDPSGARGSGVIKVHLLNVDEAPAVTAAGSATDNAATVVEAGTQPGEEARTGQVEDITFTVTADPETNAVNTGNTATGGPDDTDTLRWTLEGPDASKFELDGVSLDFKGDDSDDDGFFRPNFEDPKDADGDNVYEVTVVVPVADSVKPGKRSVKVKVTDAEDTGSLKIAAREPQVGATVSGTLTDEDGGERDRVWQWYRGGASDVAASTLTDLTRDSGLCADVDESNTTPCIIDKATAPSYQTTSADGGLYVHLVVTYTDAFDSETTGDETDTATLVARPTRAVQTAPAANESPKFGIQDREIDGDEAAPESVTRNIDEGTKAVEGGFEATDTDLLTFMLGGDDEGLFKLSDPSGSNNNVSLSLKDGPDYENPADADGDNSYEVSITAKDPSGATDRLVVTVVVGDVDDKPAISFAGEEMCEKGDTVKCTYVENGMDPVATLSVADDENDPTTWKLKADDYKKFAISADGVLTFASSPDFDSAGDGDEDNVYKVTVVADGGDRADGEKAVEVTVTDLDEPGTVKFLGNQQPQVGELMTAQLDDEDGNTVRLSWQWSKAESMEGPWEDVSSTNASYRAQEADVDSYLRATVSYTDVEFDEADEVSGVTKFKVRARPAANAPPSIPAQSIEVFENVEGTVGSVTAKDDDELIFALATGAELELTTTGTADDNDNGSFDVTDSGELKLVAKLDYEQDDTDRVDSTTDDDTTTDRVEYTAIVKATDPSGASGVGKVIVEVLNVDEAPEVTAAGSATDNAATVVEAGTQPGGTPRTGQVTAITFTVDTSVHSTGDPEGAVVNTENTATGGPDNTDTLRWTLEGPDASKFELDGASLDFKGAEDADDKFRPNFEDPKDADKDNVYEVTVVVPVADSNVPGKRSVKVTVTKDEDTGSLKIEERQPQVGASVSGKLTDEDGGIRDRVWQWYRGDDDADAATLTALGRDNDLCGDVEESDTVPCIIDKAESSSYVTTSADGGFVIHLVVTYTDAHDSLEGDGTDTATLIATPTRAVQTAPAANESPKFGIQDREIDGDDPAPEGVTRNVDEGTKAVGDFTATDGDNELFVFNLGGADGGLFGLSGPSGEENSVSLSFADAPDYENPADADGDNTYEVSITAKDPSGATDLLVVTVVVENVDDAPAIALNYEPAFDAETDERMVDENSPAGTDVGDPVVATDRNGDADTLTYSLDEMGDMYFDIDDTGQITVGEGTMLDFESETTSYSVTVTATDRGGLSDTIAVTIMVADVNEAPTFDAETAELEIAENSAAGTAVGEVVATDQDEDELTYSLDEMGDMYFDIDAMGQITVGEGTMLDYEETTSYSVTVTADDGEATAEVAVTINVTDVEESPCVLGGAVADGSNAGLTADCETLLSIMDELVGDGTALNWSEDLAIGEWEGVAGTGSGRVTHIHRVDKGLSGVLPAGITALDALEKLTLTDNDLTGEIPDLNGLDSIKWLVLGGNAFTGGIPATLGDLDSLLRLWLHRNDGGFEGGIPSELGGLPNLRYLMLHGNGLTGGIPTELGSLSNLKALYLYNNMLTGSIPAELGNLVDAKGESARLVYLHNNMLSGDVPAELGNLVSLTALRLAGNDDLTGCIPAAIIDAAVDADAAGLAACPDDGNGDGGNGNGNGDGS